MQDTELFLSLAEIAGVFVGFGALIAVRSGGRDGSERDQHHPLASDDRDLGGRRRPRPGHHQPLRHVGHQLWLACSLLALTLLAVMIVVFARTPENRADVVDTFATMPRLRIALVAGLTFWLPFVVLVLALVLVVLGPFPDQEHALYLTAVGLGLFMGAMGLFVAVFWPGRPTVAAVRGDLPASQGSSA